MIIAVATCPTCRGSGIVPAGYYASASPSTGHTEKCRTCEGKGFVVVKEG
jgi:DnaJ-class molecular chaperone